MNYTDNFGLKLPEYGEKAKVDDLNYNAEKIDNVMENNRSMIAEYFDQTQSYTAGKIVQLNGKSYRFKVDHAPGNFNPSEVDEEPIGNFIGEGGGGSAEVTKEASGNPIEFTDGSSAPLVKCVTAIQGNQDLHGYDKPWVGGAGKNKLPLVLADIKSINTDGTWSGNAYTLNGVTFTIETDGDGNVTGIKANGTPTNQINLIIPASNISDGMILNGCPAGGSQSTYYMVSGTIDSRSATDTGNGATIAGATDRVIIRIEINYAPSNLMFYPMIRLSTESDSTFAPYSNICPITGYSEVEIDGCGKNLALLSNGTQMQYSAQSVSFTDDGGVFTSNGTYSRSLYKLELEPLVLGKKYTISFKGKSTGDYNNIYFGSENILRYSDYGYKNLTSTETEYQITFTAVSKDLYVTFYVTSSATSGVMTISEFQIESGEVKTGFELYKTPNSYIIDLNGTRYSGTLDVKSGKLVVTHGYKQITSSSDLANFSALSAVDGYGRFAGDLSDGVKFTETNQLKTNELVVYKFAGSYESKWLNPNETCCVVNISANVGRIGFVIYGVTSQSDFNTWVSNNALEVCYELATPIEVALTPTAIRSLLGNNYMACSTGDMEIEYITEEYQPLVDLIDSSKHVYSTAEQVVGTWIDGKTIYEKTYSIPSVSIPSDWVGVEAIGIETLLYYETRYDSVNSQQSGSDGIIRIAYNPPNARGYICYYFNSSTVGAFNFTIRYTKATQTRSLSRGGEELTKGEPIEEKETEEVIEEPTKEEEPVEEKK